MSSRRRSPAAAPPLEDENLLSEILLRLPPQPSSLPRASAVSKRWRSLVSDPRFVRRFRIHHRRNPPLLGFFGNEEFVPTMESPNRVPEGRISFQREDDDGHISPLGCRHGLVMFYSSHGQVLVWDSVHRNKHCLAAPPWFEPCGAVLRSAKDIQHFQVVLVGTETKEQRHTQAIAHIYSSETGEWGDFISKTLPPEYSGDRGIRRGNVLVGNSLYWSLFSDEPSIIEFDLDRQRLNVIPMPVDINAAERDTIGSQSMVVRADGGGLGFLFMSHPDYIVQLWKRTTNCDGIASWVLGRTIELDKLISLNSEEKLFRFVILAYAEYNNVLLLRTVNDLFTVHLESLQVRELFENDHFGDYHLFESVYTAGMGIDDGNGGAELLHNT